MEKGVKQGKSSYPLLSMKKDQANKTNIERVYRWQPLVWEPGLNGSSIDLQLVQEWAQCSWSRVEAEGVERRWGQRWPGVSREGEGRSYHDITPLLCHYISEWHSFSMSQLAMGCVTCHACHGCVTDFRPILGNPVEVTHVTSLGHVYIFPH